jgi:TrmH family RNA methyltransferase
MAISKNDIRFIRSLQQKKVRNEERLFVVEGKKMVEEVLEMDWDVSFLLSSDELFCESHNAEYVSEQILSSCSSFSTPSGYLAVVQSRLLPKLDFKIARRIVVLNGITDPGNAGTIMRTCEWFGVDGVVMDEQCVELENPKVIQSTMGAVFRIPTLKLSSNEIIALLNQHDFHIMVADMKGESVYSFEKKAKWALVMGSESHGLSKEFKDLNPINIPRLGLGESLNVGIAAGIILSHVTRA